MEVGKAVLPMLNTWVWAAQAVLDRWTIPSSEGVREKPTACTWLFRYCQCIYIRMGRSWVGTHLYAGLPRFLTVYPLHGFFPFVWSPTRSFSGPFISGRISYQPGWYPHAFEHSLRSYRRSVPRAVISTEQPALNSPSFFLSSVNYPYFSILTLNSPIF